MTVKRISVTNRGSALITVIICMLFIGIIAATVISIAHSNLEAFLTSRKSTENFYEGEESLDLIRSQIKKMADDAVNGAYTKWLKNYTSEIYGKAVVTEDKYSAFNDYFWNELKTALSEYFYIEIEDPANPQSYITDPDTVPPSADKYYDLLTTLGITPIHTTPSDIPTIRRNLDGTITIVGVGILKEDDTGNLVSISTDMRLEIGELKVQIGANIGVNTNVAEYAVIADQTVVMSPDYPGYSLVAPSNMTLIGSVYGGGKKAGTDPSLPSEYTADGIYVKGINVTLCSDYVVTRSTLMTDASALLDIKGKQEAGQAAAFDEYQSKVWAENILMDGTAKSDIKIQGICNVADDLTINTDKSTFSLCGEGSDSSNSEYYGFKTTNDAKSAKDSSSIIINGKNVKIDFSLANKLHLAGKSYVYVPETWLQANGTGETFMQGESMTIRSLQSAYLLPGECITGVGHNPMTESDFLKIKGADMSTVDYTKIDTSKTNSAGMRLAAYLNPSAPCFVAKVAYTQNGTTTHLYYLYMNFVNPNKAAEYMTTFSTYYEPLIYSRIKMANSDGDHVEIKLPTRGRIYDTETKRWKFASNVVINTGNLLEIGYSGGVPTYTIFEMNKGITDEDVRNPEGDLNKKFTFLKTSLSERTKSGDEDEDLTNLLNINFDAITENKVEVIRDDEGKVTTFKVDSFADDGSTPRAAALITSPGDIYLTNDGIRFGSRSGDLVPYPTTTSESGAALHNKPAGIVISKGNVFVEYTSGAFWGTVIAKGNVFLSGSGKSIIVATREEKQLLQNSRLLGYYFSNGGETMVTDLGGDSIVSIDYTNWKKD